MTRYVTAAGSRQNRHGELFYDFTALEDGGRPRRRSIRVNPGVIMPSRAWITVLRRGERVVGYANHQTGYWYPISASDASRQTGSRKLWKLTGYLCLLLVALQAIRLAGATEDLLSRSPSTVVVLVGFAVVFAAPAIYWAVQTVTSDDEDEEDDVDPFADQERI
jgi:hypothetical protein